jgi:hypothetical protein
MLELNKVLENVVGLTIYETSYFYILRGSVSTTLDFKSPRPRHSHGSRILHTLVSGETLRSRRTKGHGWFGSME